MPIAIIHLHCVNKITFIAKTHSISLAQFKVNSVCCPTFANIANMNQNTKWKTLKSIKYLYSSQALKRSYYWQADTQTDNTGNWQEQAVKYSD